ncbi:2-oxoacid:acceptor oxidoreductase family protein [Nocardioides sp. zg-ZUI104]|uniref:2-oxoacid:acceptor oxidoreductase family protein n=1 Tax=Nocardioides faecalis TaxID=2803858 RepID=UPI001BCF3DE4|nr:2-oxoacid:acceptor oxidoreductase family protein [Nocardioides faecalis]MBS4751936.1 2-oxoacid:acceptor oxidoreductase family protein [Nocardioides faecalis]
MNDGLAAQSPADETPEHALMLTGIGGQGIQLVAKTLASAFTRQGRFAMLGAEYGGEMRGGPSQATVVVGDAPLRSLPVVARAHSAILFHDRFCAPTLERLSHDGLCLVNGSVVDEPVAADRPRRIAVPATATAKEIGAPQTAGFVLLGAYVHLTGDALGPLVPLDVLGEAMVELLPPYRRQHAASNHEALAAGAELVRSIGVSA